MAGKKITARKASQVCNARKSRRNARKAREALEAKEALKALKAREALEAKEALKARESVQNCIVITPTKTNTFRKCSFDELMRNSRRHEAQTFLNLQKYRGVYPCGDVKKTLISIRRPYSWTEANKSTGITWVAMYGMGFITVVFKKVENAYHPGYADPESFYRGFCSYVIDEMEDIGHGIIRPNKKLPPGIPFAVVCETTSTTNVQEASNAAPDPPAFANFIRSEIRSDFPLDKSSKFIKIAISALQLVHEQKFKADDIWVCVWAVNGGQGSLSHDSINKCLAVINRPDSGGYNEKLLVVNEPDSGACSKEENSHDIIIKKHLAVNEPDSGGCSKEENSHDIIIKKHLAVNEPDSGGCSKEEHSHDIDGGFIKQHVAVNEPDSRGRTKKELSILMEAVSRNIWPSTEARKHAPASQLPLIGGV